MHRRAFLLTSAAALATPGLAQAFVGQEYRPGMVAEALKRGETVFVDFYTTWCTTCAAQERIITELTRNNPAYEDNITFIKVNWDKYSGSKLARDLKIPRRSTLVVLKGEAELGRIVAGTSKAAIKGLLDTALGAAMA